MKEQLNTDTLTEYRIEEEIETTVGNTRTTSNGSIYLRETCPAGKPTPDRISHVSITIQNELGETLVGVLDAETILRMAAEIQR